MSQNEEGSKRLLALHGWARCCDSTSNRFWLLMVPSIVGRYHARGEGVSWRLDVLPPARAEHRCVSLTSRPDNSRGYRSLTTLRSAKLDPPLGAAVIAVRFMSRVHQQFALATSTTEFSVRVGTHPTRRAPLCKRGSQGVADSSRQRRSGRRSRRRRSRRKGAVLAHHALRFRSPSGSGAQTGVRDRKLEGGQQKWRPVLRFDRPTTKNRQLTVCSIAALPLPFALIAIWRGFFDSGSSRFSST